VGILYFRSSTAGTKKLYGDGEIFALKERLKLKGGPLK
jgi:hypothetical protein